VEGESRESRVEGESESRVEGEASQSLAAWYMFTECPDLRHSVNRSMAAGRSGPWNLYRVFQVTLGNCIHYFMQNKKEKMPI